MNRFLAILPAFLLIAAGFYIKSWLQAHVSLQECNGAIVHYENAANEIAYEKGCRDGNEKSCEFLKDSKSRYSECLNSGLINCKTWAMQYKEERERKGNSK